MPELPEVESVVRALTATSLIGQTLSSVKIICPKVSDQLLSLTGKSIEGIRRRGKYIHLVFSQQSHLIVHLRMTGQFLIKASHEPPVRHERVIFYFSGIDIAFHDTRRFATFEITSHPEEIFAKLGPEPLNPHLETTEFFESISTRKQAIKALLLDQSLLAGVGNIYADEALWEAKIHPEDPASLLSKKECDTLLQAVRKVLRKGIENGGTSLGSGIVNFHHLNGQSGKNQNTLQVYGRENQPCTRCGHLIVKITVQQRGTHFCPHCQCPSRALAACS